MNEEYILSHEQATLRLLEVPKKLSHVYSGR